MVPPCFCAPDAGAPDDEELLELDESPLSLLPRPARINPPAAAVPSSVRRVVRKPSSLIGHLGRSTFRLAGIPRATGLFDVETDRSVVTLATAQRPCQVGSLTGA